MPEARGAATPHAAPHGVRIRDARAADAAELARLSAQLGYPLSSEEAARRLVALGALDPHHVAVAESDERVLGWMHVELRLSLESGERAELIGLVVDAAARRLGVGRQLVAAAESWAASRGASRLIVRSNTAREQAHPFYESLGFARSKTQHVYTKTLA